MPPLLGPLHGAQLRGTHFGCSQRFDQDARSDGPSTNVHAVCEGQGSIFISISTGTVAYEGEAKQSPIENVAVSGNQLTFEAHDNANQVVAFRLIVADDYRSDLGLFAAGTTDR
jgi:hypothetical protein